MVVADRYALTKVTTHVHVSSVEVAKRRAWYLREYFVAGGEDRIRTCGECKPTHAFQACPLSRSGTSPRFGRQKTLWIWMLAERAGFEPAIPVARDTGFRNRRFQPLSHLSSDGLRKFRSVNNCKSPLATTYFPTPHSAVSSALRRFTSVFGMGTGGSIAL